MSTADQSGVLEVQNGWGWSRVCEKGFDTDAKKTNFANAVCKSLGHKEGVFKDKDGGNVGIIEATCAASKQLDECTLKSNIYFKKAASKGAPKDSATKQYAQMALKQVKGRGNLYTALVDCLQMPGCFAVGQNTSKAKLSFMSKRDANGRLNYDTAAAQVTQWEAISKKAGYCPDSSTDANMMVEDVSLVNFSNQIVCSSSQKNWIGMQLDIEIDASDSKKWFFNPQVNFSQGAQITKQEVKADGSFDTAVKVLDKKEAIDVQNGAAAGKLDFNVTIAKKTVIHIQGATAFDALQTIKFFKGDAAPAFGKTKAENKWEDLTPENINKAALATDGGKDIWQFFVDKAKAQTDAESFPTALPKWAEKVEHRDTGLKDGTGAPGSWAAYGDKLSGLQCWHLITHADANADRPAKEFGQWMDGTAVSDDFKDMWATDKGTGDLVQVDKDGKWKLAAKKAKFGCVTCERMNGSTAMTEASGRWQVRSAADPKLGMSIASASAQCKAVGADLPKYSKVADKANSSQGQCADAGDIQSPIQLQRENFTRQKNAGCKSVVIECTKAVIASGDTSSPRGNVRLINDTDGTINTSIIDDEPKKTTSEAFIDVTNFNVGNSQGLELVQWHTGKTGAANEGQQIYFQPDQLLQGLGPEFTYKLTWHQETQDPDASPIVQKVHAFGADSGFTGDAKLHPGRGRWFIQVAKNQFQKKSNGCVNTKVPSIQPDKQDFKQDPIEQFSCIFFAKLWQREKTSWSFTWRQLVTYDTSQKIEASKAFVAMQTPSIGATIKGIDMKASDFAKCGFNGLDGVPLNDPEIIRAGQDVKIQCHYDTTVLKWLTVSEWSQTMTEWDQNEINNQDVPAPPLNCLEYGKLERGDAKKGPFGGKDQTGWETASFSCDQQQLGPNTVHKIAMQFELNKNLRRRRRLAAGDGSTKGDEGTFGFSLSTGNCVRPKDGGDGDCGKEGTRNTNPPPKKPVKEPKKTVDDGEAFGALVAILSLFALQ